MSSPRRARLGARNNSPWRPVCGPARDRRHPTCAPLASTRSLAAASAIARRGGRSATRPTGTTGTRSPHRELARDTLRSVRAQASSADPRPPVQAVQRIRVRSALRFRLSRRKGGHRGGWLQASLRAKRLGPRSAEVERDSRVRMASTPLHCGGSPGTARREGVPVTQGARNPDVCPPDCEKRNARGKRSQAEIDGLPGGGGASGFGRRCGLG